MRAHLHGCLGDFSFPLVAADEHVHSAIAGASAACVRPFAVSQLAYARSYISRAAVSSIGLYRGAELGELPSECFDTLLVRVIWAIGLLGSAKDWRACVGLSHIDFPLVTRPILHNRHANYRIVWFWQSKQH